MCFERLINLCNAGQEEKNLINNVSSFPAQRSLSSIKNNYNPLPFETIKMCLKTKVKCYAELQHNTLTDCLLNIPNFVF